MIGLILACLPGVCKVLGTDPPAGSHYQENSHLVLVSFSFGKCHSLSACGNAMFTWFQSRNHRCSQRRLVSVSGPCPHQQRGDHLPPPPRSAAPRPTWCRAVLGSTQVCPWDLGVSQPFSVPSGSSFFFSSTLSHTPRCFTTDTTQLLSLVRVSLPYGQKREIHPFLG